MKKITVGMMAILATAIMVEVVFALPCVRSRGGDFNGDGFASMLDFASLATNWLDSNCSNSNWCDCADLDISGDVDMTDLKLLAGHWLEGMPGAFVSALAIKDINPPSLAKTGLES